MVKVCGITRREDAEVAVNAGASALGFIFYAKSPRYVEPEHAAALGAGLDVRKVGIFVDASADEISDVARRAHLDTVQVYPSLPPVSPSAAWFSAGESHAKRDEIHLVNGGSHDEKRGVQDLSTLDLSTPDLSKVNLSGVGLSGWPGLKLWKAFRVDPARTDCMDLIQARAADCEAVLLDGMQNGACFDWRVAGEFARRNPGLRVIVAGGLDAANVAQAIEQAQSIGGARIWGVDASSKLETAPGIKDHEKVRAFVKAALDAVAMPAGK
jgi:phosphoribosylanthranilate isomerase